MADPRAMLNYNTELMKCLEDLKEKRDEIKRQVQREEEDKAKIQREMNVLNERFKKVHESLQRKTIARAEYDKTIQEIENAYTKILESSQTLLHVLKRESVNLSNPKKHIGI